ncbi:hypothetical protein [Roseibium sp.]|uniref:hypothetical protein n=1 Tax=Roseibium sp. TaxID=1936156 RepID=UPI003B50A6A2
MEKLTIALVFIAFTQLFPANKSYADKDKCLIFASNNVNIFDNMSQSIITTFEGFNICIEVTYVDAHRTSLLLNQGKIDGEFFRIEDYQTVVGENAIMVPVPMIEGYGMIVAQSEEDLSLDPARPEQIAAGLATVWHRLATLPENRLTNIEDYKSGFQMLYKGRVAAVLVDSVSFMMLKDPNEKHYSKRLTPITPAFLYIHKRHTDKIPVLIAAIRKWKKDHQIEEDAS